MEVTFNALKSASLNEWHFLPHYRREVSVVEDHWGFLDS